MTRSIFRRHASFGECLGVEATYNSPRDLLKLSNRERFNWKLWVEVDVYQLRQAPPCVPDASFVRRPYTHQGISETTCFKKLYDIEPVLLYVSRTVDGRALFPVTAELIPALDEYIRSRERQLQIETTPDGPQVRDVTGLGVMDSGIFNS